MNGRTRAQVAWTLGLILSGVSWHSAAALLSVDAQARAHWLHFEQLNVDRLHGAAPSVAVANDPLRSPAVDRPGRRTGHDTVAGGKVTASTAGRQQPLPATPVAAAPGCSD